MGVEGQLFPPGSLSAGTFNPCVYQLGFRGTGNEGVTSYWISGPEGLRSAGSNARRVPGPRLSSVLAKTQNNQ